MNDHAGMHQPGDDAPHERPLVDATAHIGGETFVIVLCLALAGITFGLYLADRRGAGWIVAAIPTVLAFLWLPWVFAQRRRRVRVFSDRIEQQTLFRTRRLPFEKVERIRLGPYRIAHLAFEPQVQAYLAEVGMVDQHFPLGAAAESEVSLYGGGVKILCVLGYTGNSVELWRKVAPLVVPRLCQWLDSEIDRAGEVRFGTLTAQPEGLETPRGIVRWNEIDFDAAGPAGVRFGAAGRPESSVTVPYQTDNLLVLLWIIDLRAARCQQS